MGQTTWTGTQLGHALSGCRLESGNLLLDWNAWTTDANTVGLWHMDEAAWNGTVGEVVDSSGYLRHGQARISGTGAVPTTETGWLNRGGRFGYDAMGQYVYIPPGQWSAPEATVELWARLDAFPTEYPPLSSSSWDARLTGYWWLGSYGEGMNLSTQGRLADGTSWNGTSAVQPGVGEWFHLALTYDGNQLQLWVNGQLGWVSAGGAGKTFTNGSGYTSLGWYNSGGRYFKGMLDDYRESNVARYTAAFSPTRYPASGTGTADPATAVACTPGLLTVTLSEALPTGTSLKAKLLSTTGGDTGFQLLTGSGTSYSYDFTGAAVGSWYPQVQLFAGGPLNANTPSVTQAVLDWTFPGFPRRGGTVARFGPSLVRWCL